MKSVFLFLLLVSSILLSQVDKDGNPIFNSLVISQETHEEYTIISNYYTVANNIDNPNSSAFVSSEPANEEVIEFVRTLPSYFFIIVRDQEVKVIIGVHSKLDGKKSSYYFNVMNLQTEEQIEIDCQTTGDITEFRAAELMKLYPDQSKEIKIGSNSLVIFDKICYSVQSFNSVRKEINNLVQEYRLYDNTISLESIIKY